MTPAGHLLMLGMAEAVVAMLPHTIDMGSLQTEPDWKMAPFLEWAAVL